MDQIEMREFERGKESRATSSNTVGTGHTRLFKFNKVKNSVAFAMFQVLNRYTWLVATLLVSTEKDVSVIAENSIG